MTTHPVGELLPAWLATADPAFAIPVALFLFGLAGGFAHCAGMCAPFIFAQIGARMTERPLAAAGGLARLATGLLPTYHLGRALTYTALGAVAGAVGETIADWSGAAIAVPVGLGLAALVFAVVGLAGAANGATGRLGGLLARLANPLMRQAGRAHSSFALGVLLGLLPCHLIYAALAVAATRASALQGAIAMLAFVTGTMVGLGALGTAGVAAGRRFRDLARRFLPAAGLANAVLLGLLAYRAAWPS